MKIYLLAMPDRIAEYRGSLMTCIDPEKRQRLLRFRHLDDLDRSLIAEIFIRSEVIRRFGLRNRDIHFESGTWGKPFLSLPAPFQFNCSHSGHYVLCVISEDPVGCDIEMTKEADMGVASLVFSTKECESLREVSGEKRNWLFHRLWTRKESFIKATGEGLTNSLQKFTVLEDRVAEAEAWVLHSYELAEDYQIAVCSEKGLFPKEIQRVDTLEMLKFFLEQDSNGM